MKKVVSKFSMQREVVRTLGQLQLSRIAGGDWDKGLSTHAAVGCLALDSRVTPKTN